MAETITLAVLVGTTRQKRQSIKAANYVADFARQLDDVTVLLVDPQTFTFSGDGNDPEDRDPRYNDIVNKADAFCIVTPEYNHSFPGSLKRMLDSENKAYRHKPVALVGVSNGAWGGVRVCEALLPVCRWLGLTIIQPEVYFPQVQNIFDDQGAMKPEYTERYEKNLGKMMTELLWFARLLKSARP